MNSKLQSLKRRKIVSIMNRTDVLQTHYTDEGEIYQLSPYEVRDVSGSVAEGFIRECGMKNVSEYTPTPIPVIPGEDMAHVANMTGNPFMTELQEFKEFDPTTGKEKVVYRKNPQVKPQVIRHKMMRGEKIVQSPYGGNELLNLGSVNIEIPPYALHLIPLRIANWLSAREANTSSISGFNAIRVITGDLPDFRPNENWELDELRYWIMMVKPDVEDAVVGLSEKQLTKAGLEDTIIDRKIDLIHAAHFLIADDRYSVPSQKKFQMMYEKHRNEVNKKARMDGMKRKKLGAETEGSVSESV